MWHLALLTLFWSLPVFASNFRPEILPVKLQMSDRGQWELVYQTPCDAEELGLFFSPERHGQIKVGMVVSRRHQRCASLGPIKKFPIPPQISQSLLERKLVSFNPAIEAQRYRLRHPTKVSMSDQLYLVYATKCGPMLGVLVTPKTDGTELAVLESEDAKYQECLPDSMQLAKVPGLQIRGEVRPMLRDEESSGQRPKYELRLQPIRPGSLEAQSSGVVRMQYQRHCNQAPIGLVTQYRHDKTLLAMLVAEYPKSICATGTVKTMWSYYHSRILNPENLEQFRSARIPAQVRLEMLSGTDVDADAEQISFRGYGSKCRIKPSPVYVERDGQIYFGMINAQLPHKACKNELTELSLKRQQDSKIALSTSVKPFRLTP
ncbi:MAG: hypothetical protein ACOH5I_24755 [Oligoflexus sp.]